MSRLTDDYREYLLETLQKPREMAAYLDAALEQGDREALMVALRDVADAVVVTKLANWANLNRENLWCKRLEILRWACYAPYMEVHMELVKKTTILFSPELHEHLVRLAQQRGTSLGQLVRAACEIQYGYASPEDRVSAVEVLQSLALPVGSPRQMKLESVVAPRDLLP